MKKGLIVLLLGIFLIAFVQAAYVGPSSKYCTHMGYKINYLGEKGVDGAIYCVFDENNKCKFDEFWEGTCGQEFVKEILCRQEGEIVVMESYQLYGGKTSLYEGCCEGLTAAGEPRVMNTGDFLYCYDPFKLKVKQVFSPFLILTLIIILIILITIFTKRKFTKKR